MNLSQKILVIVLLTVSGLTAALYAATRVFLQNTFSELERREMRGALERTKNSLGDDLSKLSSTTNDYGAWDRTYEFIQHPSPLYIEQEFKDETLQGLNISAILLLDSQRKIVFFKYLHGNEAQARKMRNEIAGNAWVEKLRSAPSNDAGLLLLSRGPELIAACPILTSERKGPARGVMVMARDLDAGYLAHLSGGLRLSLAVDLLSNPRPAADFAARRAELLSTPDSVAITPWNNDVVAGYSLLTDVEETPALILRVDMPREIVHRGAETLNRFLSVLVFLAAGFGVAALASLRRSVVAPLECMNLELGRIGDARDLAMRLPAVGAAELAPSGSVINHLLEVLRRGAVEDRSAAKSAHQAFWVKDELTQQITFISPPWETIAGARQENLYAGPSEAWLASIYGEDLGLVGEMLEKQRAGEKGEAEFRILGPQGEVWWTWCRYFPVFNGSGRLIETVGLSEDMTELKQREAAVSQTYDSLWRAMAGERE
jgi:sensor domain CHASE-containing protein